MKIPTKEEIKQARTDAGLTQSKAAELIYKKIRTWQQWEAGDREMDPAFFELFKIKSSMLKKPKYKLADLLAGMQELPKDEAWDTMAPLGKEVI